MSAIMRAQGGDGPIEAAPLVFGNAAPQVLAAMLPEIGAVRTFALCAPPLSMSLSTLSLGRRPSGAGFRR